MIRARRSKLRVASIGRAVRSLLLASLFSAGTAAPSSAALPQLVELRVEVGGRPVRALCSPGPRQAVLLHGDASRADSWRPVLERLDGVVGACAYDRSGPGSNGATQRGWFELMDDMRRIHDALGFRDGYTLVGHSLGGLYARLYAADRPVDVGGLVLVDPAHEDMADELRPWVPRAAWERWMSIRRSPNDDGVREIELAKRASLSRLPDIPVTVITGMKRKEGSAMNERHRTEAARRVHGSLIEGMTHGRHVPASRSGHAVHLDEPELVAREIVRVVRQSRGWKR